MEFVMEEALSRSDALGALLDRWEMPQEEERVALSQAYGRVLACDCASCFDVPRYRVSSFDGIAVRAADFAQGVPCTEQWQRGVDYAFADTGDDFPDDFDTVIAVERVTFNVQGGFVLEEGYQVVQGSAVRAAGSQIAQGEMLCPAGTVLRPEDVALLAAGGYATVPVRRKLRVGYLPTGNELVDVGVEPGRGQTVQSNALMVRGFVEQRGAEFVEHPIVLDDQEQLSAAIDQLLAACDIVLVNGGSSRGSEDYNADLLKQRATYFSHGVKAVPGRPVGTAIIQGKVAINVPGPMFAAWLCCDWLLNGLLSAYEGRSAEKRVRVKAIADHDIAGKAGVEYLARMVAYEKEGALHAALLSHGASLARNVRQVNAWCAFAPGARVGAGDTLEVELLGTRA